MNLWCVRCHLPSKLKVEFSILHPLSYRTYTVRFCGQLVVEQQPWMPFLHLYLSRYKIWLLLPSGSRYSPAVLWQATVYSCRGYNRRPQCGNFSLASGYRKTYAVLRLARCSTHPLCHINEWLSTGRSYEAIPRARFATSAARLFQGYHWRGHNSEQRFWSSQWGIWELFSPTWLRA